MTTKEKVFKLEDKHLKDDPFNALPLETTEFDDDKKYAQFIRKVVRTVRTAPEYQDWRKFILYHIGDGYCALTGEIKDEVTIELHHHPITLYEIVSVVIDKEMLKGVGFTSLSIAETVLNEHFKNCVGYIPLVKTLHEKYHNGFQEIPIEAVKGNYKQFINEYKDYMEEDMLNTIKSKEKIRISKCKAVSWTKDTHTTSTTVKEINDAKPEVLEDTLIIDSLDDIIDQIDEEDE